MVNLVALELFHRKSFSYIEAAYFGKSHRIKAAVETAEKLFTNNKVVIC